MSLMFLISIDYYSIYVDIYIYVYTTYMMYI